MCESGKLEADLIGGEWLISSPGVMHKYWHIGKDFWKKVLDDVYRNSPDDAREAYEDFLEIYAIEKERSRSGRHR